MSKILIDTDLLNKLADKQEDFTLEYGEDHDGGFYSDKLSGDIIIWLPNEED